MDRVHRHTVVVVVRIRVLALRLGSGQGCVIALVPSSRHDIFVRMHTSSAQASKLVIHVRRRWAVTKRTSFHAILLGIAVSGGGS